MFRSRLRYRPVARIIGYDREVMEENGKRNQISAVHLGFAFLGYLALFTVLIPFAFVIFDHHTGTMQQISSRSTKKATETRRTRQCSQQTRVQKDSSKIPDEITPIYKATHALWPLSRISHGVFPLWKA